MKVTLIQFGKSHFKFVDEGVELFSNRLKHYCKFDQLMFEIPSKQRTTDVEQIKKIEGDILLKHTKTTDFIVLLDEQGKRYTSKNFASQLEKWQLHHAQIVFVIGGAYGFHEEVYARAQARLSLSDMTFSHQLIRVIFLEQLYRAYTIIKGEPYHHE
jgi:23S rRNA (pseudouridine1915-N3)-methyltransferase